MDLFWVDLTKSTKVFLAEFCISVGRERPWHGIWDAVHTQKTYRALGTMLAVCLFGMVQRPHSSGLPPSAP